MHFLGLLIENLSCYTLIMNHYMHIPKSVLIISGSPCKGDCSDLLCDEFLRGAIDGGNIGEKICVADCKIAFCCGCRYCELHGGECAIRDDMDSVLEKMISADVIVLASPVCFNSITAQLKTLIDRVQARCRELLNKEFYYIASAADSDFVSMVRVFECFRGLASCLEYSKERGVIYGCGANVKSGTVDESALQKAYEMGKFV